MLRRVSLVVASLAMLFLTTNVRAGDWDRKTTMTFNQAVEIPGMVLPAGTYVFKLADLGATRDVVLVFNEEGTELVTTFFAIPDYRLTPYDETHIGFAERPAKAPVAIHEWFYPGNRFGLEFPYR
jgi:hypothetical protein